MLFCDMWGHNHGDKNDQRFQFLNKKIFNYMRSGDILPSRGAKQVSQAKMN